MKKAIVTGLNGTIAPYVKKELEKKGVTVFKWDRNAVSTSDEEEMIQFLEVLEPDYIFHLALASYDWTRFLASYAYDNKIKFVFTSSESVFSDNGPFRITDTPNTHSDYGRYKIQCEQIIQSENPKAYIIRLGWQIGNNFSNNQMLNFLETTYKKDGYIEASDNWVLSTSYLPETAKWIVKISFENEPGIYHIEGNDDLSFYDLVKLLEQKYQKDWKIRKTEEPKKDNRLIDERIEVIKIKDILTEDVS